MSGGKRWLLNVNTHKQCSCCNKCVLFLVEKSGLFGTMKSYQVRCVKQPSDCAIKAVAANAFPLLFTAMHTDKQTNKQNKRTQCTYTIHHAALFAFICFSMCQNTIEISANYTKRMRDLYMCVSVCLVW